MRIAKSGTGGTTITVLQGKSPDEIEFNSEVRLTGGRFMWARRPEPPQIGSRGSSGTPLHPGHRVGALLGTHEDRAFVCPRRKSGTAFAVKHRIPAADCR